MFGSAAVLPPGGGQAPVTGGALTVMQANREQLTLLLRGLAAELDELDRRLTDLAWRQQARSSGVGPTEMHCERTALESARDRQNVRLTILARHLNELDSRVSDLKGHGHWTSAQVGTCPDCGYPSLGSGLCAYCAPFLAP